MEHLGKEAEDLYNKVKRYALPLSIPENRQLVSMARNLYDNFRGIFNPRELEREANMIKEYLYHGMPPGCMLTTHCSELKAGYEHLRIQLRKFE